MMRIDLLLVSKGLVKSRTSANALIREGRVTANGKTVIKPSEAFEDNSVIAVDYPQESYVSRGGYKLDAALVEFNIDATDRICLDIGASTGGFTDCLLQHRALKVYAVDCGNSQLDEVLKKDTRVVSRERTNARYLKKSDFAEEISLIVMDVSFISQTLIYPAAADILPKDGIMLTLVKPQFELDRTKISKNGIVNDPKGVYFKHIKNKIVTASKENGFDLIGIINSPIQGGDGNNEYLAYFKRGEAVEIESDNISQPKQAGNRERAGFAEENT